MSIVQPSVWTVSRMLPRVVVEGDLTFSPCNVSLWGALPHIVSDITVVLLLPWRVADASMVQSSVCTLSRMLPWVVDEGGSTLSPCDASLWGGFRYVDLWF